MLDSIKIIELEKNKTKQTKTKNEIKKIKTMIEGFPGDTVVKNPPADAGDTCSSPGLGRSHKPQSN